MKIDTMLGARTLEGFADQARVYEEMGFDGLWTVEAQHDPFLPLSAVAPATRRVSLGTAIAVAFPRSPMILAHIAWDLQAYSRGRFILGLGTQVKAHIELRFAATWDAPVARLRDYIGARSHRGLCTGCRGAPASSASSAYSTRVRTRRNARTGSTLPLTSTEPSGSTRTASPRRSRVASPTTI